MGSFNRFVIKNLTQPQLMSMMMRDVKHETEWIKDITRIACGSCPNLSDQQIEDRGILEEDIEF